MTEQRRGCGYRKVGGLYLVGSGVGLSCDRLPYELHVCPTCSQGIKPSLGFTWVDAEKLFQKNCEHESECHSIGCKICLSTGVGKVGLMWVGRRFYTPTSFIQESNQMGVSKRIGHVPRDLKIGDFVMLAHKDAVPTTDGKRAPGIFFAFHVTAIEKIVTETQSKDEKKMEVLKKKGITPVVVPDSDANHTGTVYEKEKKDE